MRPQVECGSCLTQWIYHRTSTTVPEGERLQLLRTVLGTMTGNCAPTACMGWVSNRCTDAAFDLAPDARGAYGSAKAESNRAAAELLSSATAYIEDKTSLQERFVRALELAALANVAPLGVPTGPFAFDELRSLLASGQGQPILQGDPALGVDARHVVYVLDNAGEVGFDSLVIRLLKEAGARVTLVVKEPDFFEDATLEDVAFFGLDHLVDEVVSVPGFLEPGGTGSATEALAACDTVISKGTGSFEALYGELGDVPGIFLLKVKCQAISRLLGVPVGRFVVSALPGGARRPD